MCIGIVVFVGFVEEIVCLIIDYKVLVVVIDSLIISRGMVIGVVIFKVFDVIVDVNFGYCWLHGAVYFGGVCGWFLAVVDCV